ncbi:ATP-binding cassette domain-containing protein [Thioalkalivibrio sp.]|uniref:ATP-binding cassette domain-containing protein n=1 Tax=Thioalkalivibrio sp. TaxID=2093813 RepID=UPI0039760105
MSGLPPMAGQHPLLELRDVSFVRSGRVLLDRSNLALAPQGRTVVIGPNGAGKSLLMRLAHGLLEPSTGAIVCRCNGSAAPRQAMVFQRPVLLRRSTIANVTHALALSGVPRRLRRGQAERALARFGLADLAQRPARILSGGEQQRLALARAWALEPEILFLDEPSSALDPAATKAVEDAVNVFHDKGTRIVMTTHDLGQARRLADEVVFMCGGRILEHSPASSFFDAPATGAAATFLRGELVLDPHEPATLPATRR